MSGPEEEFHLETSSSEESEDEEWVTDNEDNKNDNHDTDFEESRWWKMMKAKIRMNRTKTRKNVLVTLYVYLWCVLLFQTISFFKNCQKYTWRTVAFNNFTKNNAPPQVLLRLLTRQMRETLYFMFIVKLLKGHFTAIAFFL